MEQYFVFIENLFLTVQAKQYVTSYRLPPGYQLFPLNRDLLPIVNCLIADCLLPVAN
jgi:hypothetical protein